MDKFFWGEGKILLTGKCTNYRWQAITTRLRSVDQVLWRQSPQSFRRSAKQLYRNWGDFWQARLSLTLTRPIVIGFCKNIKKKKSKIFFFCPWNIICELVCSLLGPETPFARYNCCNPLMVLLYSSYVPPRRHPRVSVCIPYIWVCTDTAPDYRRARIQ